MKSSKEFLPEIHAKYFVLSHSRITDLTEQLQGKEEKARSERDELLDRLHEFTTESSTVCLENQSLKVCPSSHLMTRFLCNIQFNFTHDPSN